jgi:hypothetical protein
LKSIMKNATVIVLDDPASNMQTLLAVGREGSMFLSGGSVMSTSLAELRKLFEANEQVENVDLILAEIDRMMAPGE